MHFVCRNAETSAFQAVSLVGMTAMQAHLVSAGCHLRRRRGRLDRRSSCLFVTTASRAAGDDLRRRAGCSARSLLSDNVRESLLPCRLALRLYGGGRKNFKGTRNRFGRGGQRSERCAKRKNSSFKNFSPQPRCLWPPRQLPPRQLPPRQLPRPAPAAAAATKGTD
jgi:DNA-binding MarR family transcriptional regulator